MLRVKGHVLRPIGHGGIYSWLDLLVETFDQIHEVILSIQSLMHC